MIPEVFIFYDSASSLGNIWDWFGEGLRTGRARRLSKRQVSKGAAFLKGTGNYLGDPYLGEGHNISQLQYYRKASPLDQCHRKCLFRLWGEKTPPSVSPHKYITRLQKINCSFMQCSICCFTTLGKSIFLLLLQRFILIL